jgi:hypothetical protein
MKGAWRRDVEAAGWSRRPRLGDERQGPPSWEISVVVVVQATASAGGRGGTGRRVGRGHGWRRVEVEEGAGGGTSRRLEMEGSTGREEGASLPLLHFRPHGTT